MYLSASEVAVSLLGALYKCSTFTFTFYLYTCVSEPTTEICMKINPYALLSATKM